VGCGHGQAWRPAHQPLLHRAVRRTGFSARELRRAHHPGPPAPPRARAPPGPRGSGRRFPTRLLIRDGDLRILLPPGSTVPPLTATSTLAFVLVFAASASSVGLSRQVSPVHAVFVVFGPTTLSHFQDAGDPLTCWPWCWPARAGAGGGVVGHPAIRLSGLFLALATFGFGGAGPVPDLPAPKYAFGTKRCGRCRRPPSLFGFSFTGDKAFYYFVLAVVVAGSSHRTGRVPGSGASCEPWPTRPTATESVGVNPTAPGSIVFCLTAFLAAIAGGLLGSLPRREPDQLRLLPVVVLDRRARHRRPGGRWEGRSCRAVLLVRYQRCSPPRR